ncbi:hypothetical protein ACFXTH_010171 [Malus domestica]
MRALLQDRSELPNSREESTISEQYPNGKTNSMDLNSRKRKSFAQPKPTAPPLSSSPLRASRADSWDSGESRRRSMDTSEPTGSES